MEQAVGQKLAEETLDQHLKNTFMPNNIQSVINPSPQLEPGKPLEYFSPMEVTLTITKNESQ